MKKINKIFRAGVTAIFLLTTLFGGLPILPAGTASAGQNCALNTFYGTVTVNGVAQDGATVTLTDTTSGAVPLSTVTAGGGLYLIETANLSTCASVDNMIDVAASFGAGTANAMVMYAAQSMTLVNLNIVPPTTPVLSAINVSPVNPTVAIGGMVNFTASPLDQNGRPMSIPVNWTSADPTVGTINASGMFMAVDAGTTLVSAISGPVAGTSLVTVPDTVAPVITLLGTSPMNVFQNTNFTDPGTTAMDNFDGNITGNIIKTGMVNTAVLGQYLLTYNVSDAAGNAATPVTRTVNVVADTVAPVITLSGASRMDVVQGTAYTEPGFTATDNVDGNITASVMVMGTVNTAVLGQYVLTYHVTDATGNATSATRTVNVVAPTPITYTVTASAGMNGTIAPSGAITVNSGANQTFSITPNAGYQIADVLVDGMSVGALGSYTFLSLMADRTITASFSLISPSPDTTAPAITLLGASPMDVIQSMAYTEPGYTATDNVDGDITANVMVMGTVDTAVLGQYILTYHISDAAGNAASATRIVNVVAPTSITYTITASADVNGTITPNGAVVVNSNADQIFTIAPNAGYQVADVLIDGISAGPLTTYTFVGMAANHTIAASFSPVTPGPDTTLPIITLLGANPMDLIQGAAYVEPGFTAMDNVDGNITLNVIVAGMVDSNLVGTYTLTYSVSDAAGNAASVTRTVNVIAPAPVLTSIVITPTAANVNVGGTYQFNASALDQFGSPIAATISWSSSNNLVGTVGPTGLFSALATGTTTITATSGAISQTALATVNIPTAALAVTQVAAIQTFATADNTFANGWKWLLNVTVPDLETNLAMKFSDWIAGTRTIPAANNMQFYSAQSSNANSGASAIAITATNAYSANMILNGDMDATALGRQIQITLEVKVPVGSSPASYSASYGIQTLP
jgi:hypothetical protein